MIARFDGASSGPCLVAVGGIHGNEPAGVLAARRVAAALESRADRVRGRVVFLAGNTRALVHNRRFIDVDLNRHWVAGRMELLAAGRLNEAVVSEDLDQAELVDEISRALDGCVGEAYFVDLHTTSAISVPFATIGDTLRNRTFALQFPTNVVLGLEEQLDGTLLEFMNNVGVVTMGFEAGQHEHESSVDNHEAVLWVALVASGCLDEADAPEVHESRRALRSASGGQRIIEVRSRHAVRPGDDFAMEPGFRNFQPVRKGDLLARDWRGPIRAPEPGLLLLPRYQSQGDDGFFIAREVRPAWLMLSRVLRISGTSDLVTSLPGVRPQTDSPNGLIVNTRLARLFPLQVFHLLGFRRVRWTDDLLVVSRRSFDAKGPERFVVQPLPDTALRNPSRQPR